jgi:aspartate aminotransferase
MNQISASPASILRRCARELREAGRNIIELSSGNLSFATLDHVIAAAHAATRIGTIHRVFDNPRLSHRLGLSIISAGRADRRPQKDTSR